VVQTKVRDSQKQKNKKKHDCWSVLIEEHPASFTNDDFFQTFDQQWALSPSDISWYYVPIYKWWLLPDFWLTMSFIPRRHQFATLCRVLHRQRLDLFTIIPSRRKLAECWYCDVGPLPSLPVLSRFIESPVILQFIQSYKLHSYIYTFIH